MIPAWETPFLKALENSGVASGAAAVAGTGVRNAFKRRKSNPTFAAAWDAAVALHRSEVGRQAMSAVAASGIAYSEGRGGAKLIAAGQSRWSKRSEEAFLVELTATGSVRLAAKAAGFSTTTIYKRRMKDQPFMAACDAALEAGKARVQSYLVEAATRTFDPDELPSAEDDHIPKVSIGEAISIAKLPPRDGRFAAGSGGSSVGRDGRTYDETGFDTTPITREEWDEARQNIFNRLTRLRERTEADERETGRCHCCGQPLPEGRMSEELPMPQCSADDQIDFE
jgi:hypothetical protein